MALIVNEIEVTTTKTQLNADTTLRGIQIRAHPDNADPVFIGDTSSQPYCLASTEDVYIVAKLSEIYGLALHTGGDDEQKDRIQFVAWETPV